MHKPKIRILKTAVEKLANVIGYSIFTGALIYAAINFTSLPGSVPMHFGAGGSEDKSENMLFS